MQQHGFFVKTDDYIHHLEAWFHAGILERVDYIPTLISSLRAEVQWCLEHDAECRKIASNGQYAIANIMQTKVIIQYVFRVLQHIHEWHYSL